MDDGYYWARHDDGTRFIVLLEDGLFFTVGLELPLQRFDRSQIICPVKSVDN